MPALELHHASRFAALQLHLPGEDDAEKFGFTMDLNAVLPAPAVSRYTLPANEIAFIEHGSLATMAVGSKFALRSASAYVKRLKFLAGKGGRVV